MRIVSNTFFTLLLSFLLVGCGFHLRNTTTIPEQLKKIILLSYDDYSPIVRQIKRTLRSNHINFNNNAENTTLPVLRIIRQSINKKPFAIYQDGKAAEYQLTLNLYAEILIPHDGVYPISIQIFRNFFDNPSTTMGKATEQDLIYREMYQEAADQLIRKLTTAYAAD